MSRQVNPPSVADSNTGSQRPETAAGLIRAKSGSDQWFDIRPVWWKGVNVIIFYFKKFAEKNWQFLQQKARYLFWMLIMIITLVWRKSPISSPKFSTHFFGENNWWILWTASTRQPPSTKYGNDFILFSITCAHPNITMHALLLSLLGLSFIPRLHILYCVLHIHYCVLFAYMVIFSISNAIFKLSSTAEQMPALVW
jgi:hypothetical protein